MKYCLPFFNSIIILPQAFTKKDTRHGKSNAIILNKQLALKTSIKDTFYKVVEIYTNKQSSNQYTFYIHLLDKINITNSSPSSPLC